LFLLSQVLELGKPVVVAVNMIDVAEGRGLTAGAPHRQGVPRAK
jgi:Fe2+ transport system protein B